MEFQAIQADVALFSRYSAEGFALGEHLYSGSIMVRSDDVPIQLLTDASMINVTDSDIWGHWVLSSIDALLDAARPVDVILIGTGTRLHLPSIAVRRALQEKNIFNTEWMDTPAACRTYNILRGEGRHVAGLFHRCE